MDELIHIGDRVQRINGRHGNMVPGHSDVVVDKTHKGLTLENYGPGHEPSNFRVVPHAAPTGEPVYAGHHPDGSSIQNHSAGPLYPYVLVWRDKKGGPNANGKYDVGVMGPRISGTLWCPSLDDATKIAEIIKEMK